MPARVMWDTTTSVHMCVRSVQPTRHPPWGVNRVIAMLGSIRHRQQLPLCRVHSVQSRQPQVWAALALTIAFAHRDFSRREESVSLVLLASIKMWWEALYVKIVL